MTTFFIETTRLRIRRLIPDDSDAAFVHELVTDPDWLRFIGDKGVRDVEDARDYIVKGPGAMYERHGFGMFRVARREDDVPVGLCGLIKRDGLDDVDLGFAFLRDHRAMGYGFEAATAVMEWARSVLGVKRIVAITNPDNVLSARLLNKLGLRFARLIRLPNETSDTRLFLPDAGGNL